MATSLWQNILRETKTVTRDVQEMTIIVVGPEESGKSTLIECLQLRCTSSIPQSLDYGFTDQVSTGNFSGEVCRSRIHVWCVNGDGRNSDIGWQLRRSLNMGNIKASAILLTASMDACQDVLLSLESQIKCVQRHLECMDTNFSICKRNTHDSMPGCSQVQTTKFLDVPVILVVTKSDRIEGMMGKEEVKDQITILTLELRKLALKYGTSLMFHSSLKDINLAILKEFIEHLALGANFKITSEFKVHDSIFVPRGEDNESEVEMLYKGFIVDTSKSLKGVEQSLKKEFLGPPENGDVPTMECEECVECEEDQVFLQMLQVEMNTSVVKESRSSEAGNIKETNVTPSPPARRFSMTPRRMANPSCDRSGSLTHFFQTLLNDSPSRGASGCQ